MAIRYFILIVVFFIAIGCDKEIPGDYKLTDNGLKYKFIENIESDLPSLDDVMILHIMYMTEYDSVLFDSGLSNDTFHVILVEPTFKGGVEEGFAMMSPGDSAHFKVSADSIFEKTLFRELPKTIIKGSELIFHVKMKGVIERSVLDSLDSVADIESRRKEFDKLEEYMVTNNLEIMPTKNGLYYYPIVEGTGDYPVKGDTVIVKYISSLLDGSIYDASEWRDEPFKFVLGKDMILQGWEEGIPLMRKGGKAKMIIPSDLAYGDQHVREVPPYSSLLLEIEIIDIIPGNQLR